MRVFLFILDYDDKCKMDFKRVKYNVLILVKMEKYAHISSLHASGRQCKRTM